MPQRQISLISIMWAIRDARLCRNAERQLLDAIALRVNAKDFTCFPSYKTLHMDTGIHESTLKKNAMSLEKKGLIRRRIRHNKSNVFILNVTRIFQQAEKNRKADKEQKALMVADAFAGDADDSSAGTVEENEYPPEDYGEAEYNNPFADGDHL
jgi:hypothetical protein